MGGQEKHLGGAKQGRAETLYTVPHNYKAMMEF